MVLTLVLFLRQLVTLHDFLVEAVSNLHEHQRQETSTKQQDVSVSPDEEP